MSGHYLKCFLISAVAAVVAAVLYVTDALEPLENISYDFVRVRLKHYIERVREAPARTHPDVVICTIDDNSLEEIQQFPITRDWYASFLDSVPDSAMVGMDIFFIEPSPKTLTDTQREALILSTKAVSEGRLTPDLFKERMDAYLVDPDEVFRSSAERHGKLFLAMFLPEYYDGISDLDRNRADRKPLADKIHTLLLSNNEYLKVWLDSPRKITPEIAGTLEVPFEKAEDPLLIDIVNGLIVDNDLVMVKNACGQEDRMQGFFEGSYDTELINDLNMTQERIDHARMVWYTKLATPRIWEIYKTSLSTKEETTLNETARSLLQQAGIADNLWEYPAMDKELKKRYVSERTIPYFRGADKLIATFDIMPPLLCLSEAAKGLGFAQVDPDPDGKVRRYPLVLFHDGCVYPALSLVMICDYLDVDLKDVRVMLGDCIELTDRNGKVQRRIPITEHGEIYISWAGKWKDTFEKVSFAQVLERESEGEKTPTSDALRAIDKLKNKITVLGLTATGTHDFNPVPDEPRYPMVGVHANVISQILLEDYVTKAPDWVNLAAIVVAVLCVGMAAGMTSTRINLPTTILVGVLYFVAAFAAFSKQGIWVDTVCAGTGMIGCYCAVLFYRYVTEERQKRLIKGIFQYYMTPTMVEELLKNPEISLGGEKKVATVFFSDVARFTTISEAMGPEALVSLLNEYLSEMTDILLDQGAYLDKYEGDAIMAVFGVPIDHGDHAVKACRAALGNQRALARLQGQWEERNLPQLGMRIGLNTGDMIVGNIGSKKRFDYTVIGDSVNLASRLEGANKALGTRIMIGPLTQAQARTEFDTRYLGLMQVKGKEQPVKVFELLSEKGDLPSDKREAVDMFHEAIDFYLARDWEKAIEMFERADRTSKDGDPPSVQYAINSRDYMKSSPDDDWTGTIKLTAK